MSDLYGILGLSPRARYQEIKAAYRALAKRLHPDVNVGDAEAEQRIKELNRAYETLRNAERRAAYDTALVRKRAERRQRFRGGAAAFVLTVALGTLGVCWVRPWDKPEPNGTLSMSLAGNESSRQAGLADGRRPHPSPGEGETFLDRSDVRNEPVSASQLQEGQPSPPQAGQEAPARRGLADTPLEEGSLQGPASVQPALTEESEAPAVSPAPPSRMQETGPWALLKEARLGFELRYPAHVFAPAGGNAGGRLRLLVSRDGRAVVSILLADGTKDQLAGYRRSLMEERYAGASFDDAVLTEGWFVLSGTLGTEAFYEHVAVACNGRSMVGWQVVYPRAERAFYTRLVEEMRRGYRPDDAQVARCGQAGSRVTAVKRD